MISDDISFYYPLISAVIYYITVFFIAEITRKVSFYYRSITFVDIVKLIRIAVRSS